MSKITDFNRTNIEQIGKEMRAAMQVVGDKYGITVAAKPGRFTSTTFEFKNALVIQDGNATPGESAQIIEARKNLKALALFHPELDQKATYRIGGKEVKIIGYLPKRHKYPIVLEDTNGKHTIISPDELAIRKIG